MRKPPGPAATAAGSPGPPPAVGVWRATKGFVGTVDVFVGDSTMIPPGPAALGLGSPGPPVATGVARLAEAGAASLAAGGGDTEGGGGAGDVVAAPGEAVGGANVGGGAVAPLPWAHAGEARLVRKATAQK